MKSLRLLFILAPMILLQACAVYDSADRKAFDANPAATKIPATKSSLAPLSQECRVLTVQDAQTLAPFQVDQNKPELFINENSDSTLTVYAGLNVDKFNISVCSLLFLATSDRDQVLVISRDSVVQYGQAIDN